jgi:spore coat polysaccharide biosynthesis protein SpsF
MKIGALIPIRLASKRLPGKALIDICGRPVVHHLLDRIAGSRHITNPTDVVVCTTTHASDDPLEKAVTAYGCSIFRGSPDDLIRRFADAIRTYGFDAVLQADGDDPLADRDYLDRTMDRLLTEPSLDIVSTIGLPLGCNTRSFTTAAMKKVEAVYRTTRNDTGFMHFFTRTGTCNHAEIGPDGLHHVHKIARLTLDYEVDLNFFRRVFEALYRPGEVFGLTELVRFLTEHPEVIEINRSVSEEYWQNYSAKVHLDYSAPDGTIATITS